MVTTSLLRQLGSRSFCQLQHVARAARCSNLQRCRNHCTASTSIEPSSAPIAAAIIIGDEILSGSITDVNTPWLARLLHSRGVDLVRVEYIPDNKEDIKATVIRLRERVGPQGAVFTSGGIGPTHDDVTYEAIADALGIELAPHEGTLERMRVHYEKRGVELNAARQRMAALPVGSTVYFTPGLWVPLAEIGRVFILPGIPRLFQAMLEQNKELFTGPSTFSQALYTNLGEGDVAVPLAQVAEAHPKVRIGSYPNTDNADTRYRVKLQFEARDGKAVEAAVAAAEQALQTFKQLA